MSELVRKLLSGPDSGRSCKVSASERPLRKQSADVEWACLIPMYSPATSQIPESGSLNSFRTGSHPASVRAGRRGSATTPPTRQFAVLRQLTAKGRLAQSVRTVREGCRRHRHAPLLYPRNDLARVLRGHGADYGRSGNRARMASFRYQVIRIWRKWLSRRSRSARVNWDPMTALLRRLPLPTAKIVHGYGTA